MVEGSVKGVIRFRVRGVLGCFGLGPVVLSLELSLDGWSFALCFWAFC